MIRRSKESSYTDNENQIYLLEKAKHITAIALRMGVVI
jgi:hypothetical protein